MNIILKRKCIVDTDVVNDTYTRQSFIKHVVIRCFLHDVIHWITATVNDKVYFVKIQRNYYYQYVKKLSDYVCLKRVH